MMVIFVLVLCCFFVWMGEYNVFVGWVLWVFFVIGVGVMMVFVVVVVM